MENFPSSSEYRPSVNEYERVCQEIEKINGTKVHGFSPGLLLSHDPDPRCFNIPFKFAKELAAIHKRLEIHEKFCREIDDYFEYRNESEKDKSAVYEILSTLTQKLSQ